MHRGSSVAPSLFAALFAVACGSSSSPGSTSPPSGVDSGADAAIASGGDAAIDSPPLKLGDGGALACGQGAAAYCAAHPCTESAALADVCAHYPASSFTLGCGGLDALTDGVEDASSTYYFDPSTGDLVAVVDSGSGGPNVGGVETCVAGPATFIAPKCPSLAPMAACIEAGSVANRDASTAE